MTVKYQKFRKNTYIYNDIEITDTINAYPDGMILYDCTIFWMHDDKQKYKNRSLFKKSLAIHSIVLY